MTEQARALRRTASRSEKLLWEQLQNRKLGVKFRRQHPIKPYIVDFACLSERLVVEVDGPQHDLERDAIRDTELRHRGYRVLRVTNLDVLRDVEKVVEVIRLAL
ncbi:MAG: endonuclease domain-containing protein [Acidimicrobiia bacterium]|nr:endonuclease domain-containing protein [Acidimicrobiia bacterium]